MRASVIIAAHNEGRRLARTVESVIEGAGSLDYEIIIADDASDDASIEESVRRFPRVRVVRHDPTVASSLRESASLRNTTTDLSRSESPRPLGCSPTKDLGARHARGDVLVFLDGHTLPDADAIRRLVEDVERTAGQAIITPRIVGLDAERWKLNRSQRGYGYRLDLETMSAGWLPLSHLKPVRQGGREFYESPAFIGCAFAISRELYDKLHGFDSHMFVWGVEDVDLSLRCWLLGHPILHDPEPCVGHRFRRTFDNYEVPREHVVANQIRMAFKCMSPSPFADWTDRARQRYSIALPDHPEGLWTAAWTLFEQHCGSAETERAHLHARRIHDELWYAARFQLGWPRLAGEGLEPGGEMFAMMEGTSAPPPERRTILLFGYWPPTDIGVDARHGMLWQWKEKTAVTLEGKTYDVLAISPVFDERKGTYPPPDFDEDYWGTGAPGAEGITVDYRTTSTAFWELVEEHRPIAVMSFSRWLFNKQWAHDAWATNWARDQDDPPLAPEKFWTLVLASYKDNDGDVQPGETWEKPFIGGSAADPSPFNGAGAIKYNPPRS
jgi:GT2 family glycosyltransferase